MINKKMKRIIGYCSECEKGVIVAEDILQWHKKSIAHIKTYHGDESIDKPIMRVWE